LAVSTVSFDVTGTLLALPHLGEVYAGVLARHGPSAPPEELDRVVRELWQELSFSVPLGEDRFSSHPQGARGFWRDLLDAACRRLGLPHPSPFAAAELYDRFAHPEPWELYPDVLPALGELRKRGFRLAVISNFDRRLPGLLDEIGLSPLLEAVVCSEEVGVEKPHPAIFESLLEELDLPAGEVLHVGDRRREDVEGARAVGMEALLLDRLGGRGDLGNLTELPARLAGPQG
jgi:putative hydrolase of the HAD superfamily